MLKEELGATEQRLAGRLTKVETGFENLQEDVKSLERRMDVVEQQRSGKERALGLDSTSRSLPNCPKLERYWKARQSLRLWPIEGKGEQMRIELQKFLSQRLRLGEDVVSDTGDCSLRRIPPSKNSTIKGEVTVEFPSVELRDVVRGAAYNQRQASGLRYLTI